MPDTVAPVEDVAYVWSTFQTGETTESGAGGTGGRKDPLQGGTVSWQTVNM